MFLKHLIKFKASLIIFVISILWLSTNLLSLEIQIFILLQIAIS